MTKNVRYELNVLIKEYKRPWKLFTFMIGVSLLITGAILKLAPDWDIPISIIMAVLTYLTAPLSLTIIVKRQWKLFPVMLFSTWFSVDGCYWLYWHFKNPIALEIMRDVNFLASLTLYGICGLVWMYQGSLRGLLSDIKSTRKA